MGKLTDTKIKRTKPGAKPIRMSDGNGLTMIINPNGSRLWRHRFKRNGKDTQVAIGSYPEVSLAAARERALELRSAKVEGTDPKLVLQKRKREKEFANLNTFADVAEDFMAKRTKWSESHSTRFRFRMEKDVFPVIGATPIADITTPDCLIPVRRIEARGSIETAKRVAAMMGQVFQHATFNGLATSNPASGISSAVQDTPATKHRPAITDHADLGRFMHKVWNWPYCTMAKPLIQLALLTFARPGEIRQMRWDQIDFDKGEWTYKVSKVGLEGHIVPLSRQALEIIESLRPKTGRREYVFANPSTGKPVTNVTPSQFLNSLGYQGVMSAHGSRATARTILVETLEYPEALVELQLSHGVRDIHGRAYNRVQWRRERAEMMQHWADWLDVQRRAAKAEELGIAVA